MVYLNHFMIVVFASFRVMKITKKTNEIAEFKYSVRWCVVQWEHCRSVTQILIRRNGIRRIWYSKQNRKFTAPSEIWSSTRSTNPSAYKSSRKFLIHCTIRDGESTIMKN